MLLYALGKDYEQPEEGAPVCRQWIKLLEELAARRNSFGL
jgi:hypothetical protein